MKFDRFLKVQWVLAAVPCLGLLMPIGSHAQQLPMGGSNNLPAPTNLTLPAAAISQGVQSSSVPSIPNMRASDPINEAARLTSRAIALEPLKPNDFQQFILQTTGQRLPIFGYQFFENINASQAHADHQRLCTF